MRNKLGIIVPYRNRPTQLNLFLSHITNYLSDKDIRYQVFIVDQDNGKQFNRGMLLNIGFIQAVKAKCNYVIFHDVDMLPIDVDYSYSDKPLHLATDFILNSDEKERETFDEYFGGVTLFPVEVFKKINGYSNKYWAWGYEDTDLLYRCIKHSIDLDTLKLKNLGRKGKSLKFNGLTSMVKAKNVINFNSNATIFISFYPDKLLLDHTKESDEFSAFSIPGWDFAICFSSFSRYNFCAFDMDMKALYVNSKIKTNYKTVIVVTIESMDKKIKVYQDGEKIGETEYDKRLFFYRKEPYFYLGVGNPNRDIIPNYFKGYIDTFAYFDECLKDEEVMEISQNKTTYLTKNFGNYKSSKDLKCYYDVDEIWNYKLTDLTGNRNDAEIIDCEVVDVEFDDYVDVKIPHKRKSLFKSLPHEENGFLGNKWKDQATRWNQLRFNNEVSTDDTLLENDGLSTLEYIEHDKIVKNNITHIRVGV